LLCPSSVTERGENRSGLKIAPRQRQPDGILISCTKGVLCYALLGPNLHQINTVCKLYLKMG